MSEEIKVVVQPQVTKVEVATVEYITVKVGQQGVPGIQGDKGDKGDPGDPAIYKSYATAMAVALG